jgi:hypothetical protein
MNEVFALGFQATAERTRVVGSTPAKCQKGESSAPLKLRRTEHSASGSVNHRRDMVRAFDRAHG